MIDVSSADKVRISKRPLYKLKAMVYKASGTTFQLNNNDFAISGNRFWFEGDGKIPLGKAIAKQCELNILKRSGFGAADFKKARIYLEVYIGDDADELFSETYWVDDVAQTDDKITVRGSDAIGQTDKIWVPPALGIPVNQRTLYDLVCRISTDCGFPTMPVHFTNDDFVYRLLPYGYTGRELLGYIAMIAGGNAVATHRSHSPLSWGIEIKEIGALETNRLESFISRPVMGEEINITGFCTFRTIDDYRNKIEPQEFVVGDEGYIVEVENPLIWGHEEERLDDLLTWSAQWPIVNSSWRHIAYPLAEYGDAAYSPPTAVYQVNTLLTDMSWELNGGVDFGCNIDMESEEVFEPDHDETTAGTMTTVNSWRVSKLTNGLTIATCEVPVNGVPCTTALGGWFQSSAITLPDYPTGIFTEAPRVALQFHTTTSASCLLWTVGDTGWDQIARPEPLILIRPVTGTITGVIHIIAIGPNR